MTITPVPVTGFPGSGFPITTITPLTYRDGVTYLEKMETLRRWVENDLIVWMETSVTGLSDDWKAEVMELVSTVNAALTAQANAVNTALSTQDAEVQQKLDDITEYVNTTVQQIIDNSLEANDGLVHDLVLNIATATRTALDTVYQHKDSVNDTAVAALVSDDESATQNALDLRYFRAEGDTLSVGKGGTGRTSNDVANALLVSGDAPTDALVLVAPGTVGQVLTSGGPDDIPVWGDYIDDAASGAAKTYSSAKIETLVASKALYGTYAGRPAAGTVKAGTIYACSDVPETYMSNGNIWRNVGAGGNEIGYAEQSALVQTTSATSIPGLSTTFVVGERPIKIHVTMRLAHSTVGKVAMASILLDEAEVARIEAPAALASVWDTKSVEKTVHGLTPGSTHTARVTLGMVAPAAGTALTAGDATNFNNISVVTV